MRVSPAPRIVIVIVVAGARIYACAWLAVSHTCIEYALVLQKYGQEALLVEERI